MRGQPTVEDRSNVADHNRVTIRGTLYGTERFACQLHFGLGTGAIGTFAQLTAAAEAIATYLESIDGGATTNELAVSLGAQGVLTDVDVATISNGSVLNTGTAAVTWTPFSGASDIPPQSALVTSLLTDVNSGSYRGRFYWPMLVPSKLTNGLWSGNPTNWLTAVADLLNAIANAIQAQGGGDLAVYAPAVYSRKLNALTVITRLRVNNVVDTQRRRSWDLLPTATTEDYLVGT